LDKQRFRLTLPILSSQQLMPELLIHLTMWAGELNIANEILIIDGAPPAFCRSLRGQFTERSKKEKRIRPFKNIIGTNARNEDGLQLADMIAGVIRLYAMGVASEHFYCISPRIVALWEPH